MPTGYELSQLNVSFAALLCAEFIPGPRYEQERNLEPSLPPPSLFSGSRVEHQPWSFVVREAREGQVLNASAQIHRDESGKYSNGTRPPQKCPLVIRGLSKHLSIRTGGRLMTNSRRPFSFILCGLGTAHASADRIPQSCRSGINKVRVTPTTPLAFF